MEKETGLQFTSCKKCGTSFLVGVNGKDVRDAKASSGFLAIGNEELKKSTHLPDKVPCKKCGNMCKVETATANSEPWWNKR